MSDELHPLQTRASLLINRHNGPGDHVVVTLRGELDMNTSVNLRAEITAILAQRPIPTKVVVDLAGVTFVDSLGLGTLVVGHRICSDLGVLLIVRNPSTFADRLLEVSGFGDLLRDSSQ